MRRDTAFSPFGADNLPKVELELLLADGSPWRLTFSPGIERFIGHYPRLDGIDAGGPLLQFRIADPA